MDIKVTIEGREYILSPREGNVWYLWEKEGVAAVLFKQDSVNDLLQGTYTEVHPGLYMHLDECLLYEGNDIPAGKGSFKLYTRIETHKVHTIVIPDEEDLILEHTEISEPIGH